MKIITINLIMDAVKDQRKGIFEAESESSPDKNYEVENMDESDPDATPNKLEELSYDEKK